MRRKNNRKVTLGANKNVELTEFYCSQCCSLCVNPTCVSMGVPVARMHSPDTIALVHPVSFRFSINDRWIGYTGANCETPVEDCQLPPHGQSNPNCTCPPPFTGPNCTCQLPFTGPNCTCQPPFTGPNCTCPPQFTGPNCTCPPPFTGPNCTCQLPFTGPNCTCPPPFTGPECNITMVCEVLMI